MLKVLHLFEQYLPSTEVWAFNLLKYLPDTEIHVAANHYLKNNFYESAFSFFENDHDGLKRKNQKLGKLKTSNFLQKIVLKAAPFLLGDPIEDMIEYGRKAKIQIVHAHFGKVAWHFRKVPKALDIPFVVSFYGWDYEMLPYLHPVYEKRYQQLFQEADCFLCEGENGVQILKSKGCPPEKIKVAHLGIDINNIPFYQRPKQKGELSLLQIASFTSKKGYQYTVDAFAEALKSCPNLSLTLLGDAREKGLKENIKKQIIEKGLEDKIRVLDPIPYDELYPFMQDFQVFIHPSHYTAQMDCEGGAPIILLDAQATGMPVISTRHCDIPEEVLHQKTGLLVEEKDVTGLAKAIETFYQMEEHVYQGYSSNARAHVLENYHLQTTSLEVRKIYDTILRR